MYTRISDARQCIGDREATRGGTRAGVSILLAVALVSCGDHGGEDQARPDAAPGERIACAHSGAPLSRTCTVDRKRGEGGVILTIRHPDGAFRRLLTTDDGRGIIAADGAQRASVSVVDGGEVEVALAGDRYRLPATVTGATP